MVSGRTVREIVSREWFLQLVVSVFVGLSGVMGSYFLVGRSPSFVSTSVSRFLSREMPAFIVQYAIMILGNLGQQLNLAVAVLLTVGLFSLIVFGAYRIQAVSGAASVNLPLAVFGLLIASYLLSGSFQSMVGVVMVSGGILIVIRLVGFFDSDVLVAGNSVESVSDSRRSVIVAGLGAMSVGLLGWVKTSGSAVSSDISQDNPSYSLLKLAEEESFSVSGLEPLVSTDFYEVDINSIDPRVDADEWSLTVGGSVSEEVQIDFDALESMETERRFETLRCVGEGLNGKKMDNAVWTGTPVMPLLEEAGVESGCDCVMVRAEDDYYQEFPIEALEDAMLAYQMNGQSLPRGHGAPVRLLVPGHWGEINVKWVSEIEVLEREAQGYWEERGWHGTGPVNTVAKLHAVNTLPDGRKEIGGHAYAGVRGVSAVEVSTDGGETWEEAELSAELEPSVDVWRQWKYTYEPPETTHTVVVRAIESDGTVQSSEQADAFPNGASGWVSREIS